MIYIAMNDDKYSDDIEIIYDYIIIIWWYKYYQLLNAAIAFTLLDLIAFLHKNNDLFAVLDSMIPTIY